MKTRLEKIMMTLLLIVSCSMPVLAQNPTFKHVVDKGETIESIAKKYGVTKESIIELNPDAAQFVYVGMELKIPEVIKNESLSINNMESASSTYDNNGKPQNTQSYFDGTNYSSLLTEGRDVFLSYSPDAKLYGIGFSQDINKYFMGYFDMVSNLKFGKNDSSTMLGTIGVGIKQRYCFNDMLMLNIKMFPYVGISGYDYINEKRKEDFKTELTYGARAEASIGFKLFTNKNGNDVYLTLGYMIGAAEFETADMFKTGMIKLGYSIIFK